MATNRKFEDGRYLTLDVSGWNGGASDVASGTPVAQNSLGGVVLYDAESGETTIDTGGVYSLTVLGSSVASISVGDKIYVDDGDTSGADAGDLVNSGTNGAYLGIALEATSSDEAIKIRIG